MRDTPLALAYGPPSRGSIELLGWRYPRAFGDATAEHRAVRRTAGLFDFSFMAHGRVSGRDALAYVQRVITNDASRLDADAALYSPICAETGAMVDDCTVVRRGRDEYLITTGLHETWDWLARHRAGFDVALEDQSDRISVLAVQGPSSASILADLGVPRLEALRYLRVLACSIADVPVTVARIGYTGELGYEVFAPAERALELWQTLSSSGALVPCGGLALETLRIEAGYLMTQVDFDATVTPIEAGLGRFVKLAKGEFIGSGALRRTPPRRRLVGLRIAAGPVPRRGASVRERPERVVGRVTSACLSPTLGDVLTLAYVEEGAVGSWPLAVDGAAGPATLTPLPFYDPSRARVRAVAEVGLSRPAAARA